MPKNKDIVDCRMWIAEGTCEKCGEKRDCLQASTYEAMGPVEICLKCLLEAVVDHIDRTEDGSGA